jgi:hypothetical protein
MKHSRAGVKEEVGTRDKAKVSMHHPCKCLAEFAKHSNQHTKSIKYSPANKPTSKPASAQPVSQQASQQAS